MGKKEYSQYQQSVISGYYKNLDIIMLQKLSELVTELYRAHKAMVKLKIRPATIAHIMEKQDVQILAQNLQGWLGKKKP
jgi:hypothetical protein